MIKYSKELDQYCKEHGILLVEVDKNIILDIRDQKGNNNGE